MGVGGDGKLIGWESGGGSKAECRQQDDGGQREPAEAGVQGAEIDGGGEEGGDKQVTTQRVPRRGSDRGLRCPHRSRDGVPSGSGAVTDRKSTRLNSSHLGISYAVFCLKK